MSEVETRLNSLYNTLSTLSSEDLQRLAVIIGVSPEQEERVLLGRTWEVLSDRMYTGQDEEGGGAGDQAPDAATEEDVEEFGDDADGSDTETIKGDGQDGDQE